MSNLTLEFRVTDGRRSLTVGQPWNELLELVSAFAFAAHIFSNTYYFIRM